MSDDKKRTLADTWQEFDDVLQKRGVGKEDRKSHRYCFFSGASLVFGLLLTTKPEEGKKLIEDLRSELVEWAEKIEEDEDVKPIVR